jgi:hypothetical protein
MSAQRSGESHATAWVLLLLAIPVLYLLSAPLIVRYVKPSVGVFGGPGPVYLLGEPEWVRRYYFPYLWLETNTPLRHPLRIYARWWVGL